MNHHRRIVGNAARSGGSRKGFVLAGALGLAAVPVVAFAPMAAATPTPSCVVAIGAAAPHNYGNLQKAVNADTASLPLTVKSNCTGDTTISKSLTITGSGSGWTLHGGNSSSKPGTVVTVSSGYTVTIAKLDITGGYATGNGGGINNAGSLKLRRDSISRNTAKGDGGGIFNTGTLTQPADPSGVSIDNNTAANGGGIYNDTTNDSTATVTLTNASVNGNTATGKGGGIYNDGGSSTGAKTNTATVSLTNTSVNNNKATNGGGIYNDGASGVDAGWYAPNQNLATVTLTNASVNSNTATANGGGIFNDGGSGLNSGPNVATVALSGTSVKGNKAANGGGIYNDGGTGGFSQYWGTPSLVPGDTVKVTLSNSDVTSNTATANGGGIYNDGGTDSYGNGDTATVTFANAPHKGTSVTKNKATYGGGIYNTNDGGAATVTLSDTSTSVTKNTATASSTAGGGIYISSGTVSGHTSDVFKNTGGNINP
jgi:predicted outer membrane repeat protein